MHPCLEEVITHLQIILRDPSNVPKVIDRVNQAMSAINQYGNQGPTNAPAPEPEAAVPPAPERKPAAKREKK
jgi:hypothetical protein